MTASTLPSMGITDWKHIKVSTIHLCSNGIYPLQVWIYITQIITEKVRELLGVEPPYWNRSITLPYASDLAIFLEQKSFTGRKSDQLHYHPHTLNSSQYQPITHFQSLLSCIYVVYNGIRIECEASMWNMYMVILRDVEGEGSVSEISENMNI